MKKKILLIATGGTIACKQTDEGLTPKLEPHELLAYVPEAEQVCDIDCIQLFCIDSTNMRPEHWIRIEQCIEENYSRYDGFVICHGTDTMAYTSAGLSYLIQGNGKPVVITGAQRPINVPISDARANLFDSIVFASDDRARGVNLVFGGKVISGTRAKKEYSHNYNAFSSINYPEIAVIQDGKVLFYIKDSEERNEKFYRQLNSNVFLLKMIPGISGDVLSTILHKYDGVVIETFGVGGLPEDEEDSFYHAIEDGLKAGKMIVVATQVTHEGSDLSVYKVGKRYKEEFSLLESYDMGLEATVTKVMWVLAMADTAEERRNLFYTSVNHDLLFADS